MFGVYLARWGLTPDGPSIVTHASRLLPVRVRGAPAMLKVATAPEEKFGAALMAWWAGRGAARVLAREGDAILLERATGTRSLDAMARAGRDGEATRIICAAVAALHAPRQMPRPRVIPLTHRFEELAPAAKDHGGIFAAAAAAARELLASPRDVVALHGDIHHGNILDFGARGWLAIDPKGLLGERAFDYANLFCNPDHATATDPARFHRRVAVVADAARLEPRRLQQWVLAWSGLSASWSIADGTPPDRALAVGELAAAALAR